VVTKITTITASGSGSAPRPLQFACRLARRKSPFGPVAPGSQLPDPGPAPDIGLRRCSLDPDKPTCTYPFRLRHIKSSTRFRRIQSFTATAAKRIGLLTMFAYCSSLDQRGAAFAIWRSPSDTWSLEASAISVRSSSLRTADDDLASCHQLEILRGVMSFRIERFQGRKIRDRHSGSGGRMRSKPARIKKTSRTQNGSRFVMTRLRPIALRGLRHNVRFRFILLRTVDSKSGRRQSVCLPSALAGDRRDRRASVRYAERSLRGCMKWTFAKGGEGHS